MQFYIIDDDPETNAKELPDYCLKKVNIREGWQILSDIGHAMGVTWEGQNGEYNRYHAETRQYWKDILSFKYFIDHYSACLDEFERRFLKDTIFRKKFTDYLYNAHYKLSNEFAKTTEKPERWQIIEYIATRKTKFLTDKEWKKLNKEIVNDRR